MTRLQPPPITLLDKYDGDDFQVLYSTTITVTGGETGHGRASGVARSEDGSLEISLRLPGEMGVPAEEPIRSPYAKMARQGITSVVALESSV